MTTTKDANHEIHELVRKVQRGELRLPEMQRPFVWKVDQCCKLLDSLYRGYPVGTILIWDHLGAEADSRALAVEKTLEATRQPQMLLDGQQRLTTLTSLIAKESIKQPDDKEIVIKVMFDLNHSDLTLDQESDDEKDETDDDDLDERADDAEQVPAPSLSDQQIFSKFDSDAFKKNNFLLDVAKVLDKNVSTRQILKQIKARFKEDEITEELEDKFEQRLRKLKEILTKNIRAYELPSDMPLSDVTQVFVRVNSQGTKLMASDLAMALVTEKRPGFSKIIESFRVKSSEDFEPKIDTKYFMRNLVIIATGQSKYKQLDKLTADEIGSAWEQVKDSFSFAIKFVRDDIGMTTPSLISSPYILCVLGYYCYLKNFQICDEDKRQIKRWVKLANIFARYSGTVEAKLNEDLHSLQEHPHPSSLIKNMESQARSLEIFPKDLEGKKLGSAFTKMMFLAFKSSGASDWKNNSEISLSRTREKFRLQYHHIFPRAYLIRNNITDKDQINHLANIAFISAESNKKISSRPPNEYIREIIKQNRSSEVFDKQSIPLSPSHLLDVANYGEFITKRSQLVADALNAYINKN